MQSYSKSFCLVSRSFPVLFNTYVYIASLNSLDLQ